MAAVAVGLTASGRGEPGFPLAVVWGIGGIAAGQYASSPLVGTVAASVAVLVAATLVWVTFRPGDRDGEHPVHRPGGLTV